MSLKIELNVAREMIEDVLDKYGFENVQILPINMETGLYLLKVNMEY